MTIFLTLMSMLAVWRATRMLQEEDGPFGIFARLQAWVASKPDKVGGINEGFYCFYCLSVWISILPAIWLATSIPAFFVFWFGISAGAIFLYNISEKNN